MAEPARILIVDDDQEMRDILLDVLTGFGFQPTAVNDGQALMSLLRRQTFDLILLDIIMPGDDGLSLCRTIRASKTAYAHIPIIFISALKRTSDRVAGLEIGGDDYLPKPFQTRELAARIRALLRRVDGFTEGADYVEPTESPAGPSAAPAAKSSMYRFGSWLLDLQARHLLDSGGQVVQLSSAEYRLLMIFLQHPQEVLSREKIMEYAKELDYGLYDRSIDVQISRLRAKLRDSGRSPSLIVTMRGDGYMLTSPVETI